MKFKIRVKNEKDDWWEEYEKNCDDPELWALEIVERFNETLRPRELPRELLEVVILDD